MRKSLAIILSLIMVLSLCFVGVSAEGEPILIKTVDDYKNIANDMSGNYKLDADLTISEEPRLGGTFKGTFDGNGHTITLADDVTGGFFSTIDGATISNLTFNGRVKASGNAGALCNTAQNNFKIINVINNADVSSTGESAYVGGLVGQVSTGSAKADAYSDNQFIDCVNNGKIHGGSKTPRVGGIAGNNAKYAFTTYTNCVNNGKIDVTQDEGGTELSGASYAGGIAAGSFGGKFVNCLNTGDIYAEKSSDMGGIVGRFNPSTQKANQSITIISCTNEGNLVDHGRGVGGIAGYGGTELKEGATGVYTIQKCVNKGNVTMESAEGGYVGGIIPYIYGQSGQYGVIEDCVNYGTITGKTVENESNKMVFGSQILGYSNTTKTQIKNCFGLGKLVVNAENRSVFIGMSSAAVSGYTIDGNAILKDDGTTMYSYTATEANSSSIHPLADADPAKLAVLSKDELTSKVRALGQIGYIAPQQDPVNPPVDPVNPPVTGDALVAVVVVALVSVLGMGIAIKAKNN